MRRVALPLLLSSLLAVLPAPPAAALSAIPPLPVERLASLHKQVRVEGLEQRVFTAEHWWQLSLPGLTAERGFAVETIGQSAQGRPLRHVQWGNGPVHVLLWSQMHGDESTATMALADLLAWLGDAPDQAQVRLLDQQLTLHLVPMLNPDGAAVFSRRNAQGIDINRDAAALASPEARALKALRDRIQPAFGFNLHDQRPGYRAGSSDSATAVALLAPPMDAARSVNDVRARAIGVAAHIADILAPVLPRQLARWDDTFNPRAFGDLMQAWGTSTVLLEAGGIEGDTQKQQLRAYTFSAIVAGLQAIADGRYAKADPLHYQQLPENGAVWPDLLLTGATVHRPGALPARSDVLVNFRHALSFEEGTLTDIGDLSARPVRRRIDASGLHLHPLPGSTLALDAPARLLLSRDAQGREVVWTLDGSLDPAQSEPAR